MLLPILCGFLSGLRDCIGQAELPPVEDPELGDQEETDHESSDPQEGQNSRKRTVSYFFWEPLSESTRIFV